MTKNDKIFIGFIIGCFIFFIIQIVALVVKQYRSSWKDETEGELIEVKFSIRNMLNFQIGKGKVMIMMFPFAGGLSCFLIEEYLLGLTLIMFSLAIMAIYKSLNKT